MLAMKRRVFLCWTGFRVATRLIYKICSASAAALMTGISLSQTTLPASLVIAFAVTAFIFGYLIVKFSFKDLTDHNAPPEFSAQSTALSAFDILDVFPNPAIIFDGQGIVLFVNPVAKQAFRGLDTGIGFNQWFRDAKMLTAFSQVKSGGKPAHVEFIEKRPLERAFRVDLAAIDTSKSAILMVFTEHTEALRVDRMRADFIANASHELRTPLTAVTGFLETLQGPARNDVVNRDRFIVLMLEQTQRMARLIDDLLSLSRFETQSAPGKMQQVDLGLLAGTTVDALTGLAAQHNVEIDNALLQGSLIVDGDPDELTQVLQNLIENAVKYGAAGGRIEIGVAKANLREKGFFVRDFGAGIPSEHIPRLTERFYRVDIEASRQQKGTGLGLAIVKHILTRHRARLVIESRQGEGSTFSILFPIST
jgi:two-component system, OmpR family, phosphate regulon sensor histidine kinase PhoR